MTAVEIPLGPYRALTSATPHVIIGSSGGPIATTAYLVP
jgi:hypothetical protein